MLKKVFVCFIFFCGVSEGMGKHPSPRTLYDSLSAITKIIPEENQLPKLEKWIKDWQQYRYGQDSTFIAALNQLALIHYYKNNFQEAISLSQQVIQLQRQPSSARKPDDLSKAFYRLGVYYTAHSRPLEAVEALENAIQYGHGVKAARKWVSNAHLYLIYVHYNRGDYQKSLYHAQIGVQMATDDKDNVTLSRILHQQAQALDELGRASEAIPILERSIKLLEDEPKYYYSLAVEHRLLGQLYKKQGDSKRALKELLSAYEIAKIDKQELSDFPNAIGLFYHSTGNYAKALAYYQEAIRIDNSLYNKANLHDHIGRTHAKLKDYPSALKSFQKGLSELKVQFTDSDINHLPNAETVSIAAQKRYFYSLIQDKADTWLDYFKATKTKSHLTNALKTYALADSMIDFMRYEHAGEGSKLFWRQKTHGMYERAIEACYLADDKEQAFHFFEKSKAVLLADKLNELGANQQLPEADAKHQKSLRDSISNLQNQLASLAANDKKRPILQNRLEKFNDDFETFRKNLEKSNLAYYRYKYDNSTPAIATFKEKAFASLGGTGAFVSYFVGDSAVYAFTLRDQAKLIRLNIKPAEYQTLATEFLNLCANRAMLNAHYTRYRTLAYSLYQHLWQPLGIIEKRVIISSDGEFLPFEALLSAPTDDAFLLHQHAISYTYSAHYLTAGLQKPKSSFWGLGSFVGFAPETFAASLKQATLNGSKAALEAVENTFFFGKTFTNTDATKAQFLRSAPTARVIQLFTHAEAGPTETAEPTIYFQDAPLRLSELNQTDGFDTQLLVLSACKTGVGQNQRGEGVFSLARGFAALGIGSTVTTLWNVEDQPTYELTKLFYTYLDEGLPKDEALQRAKWEWLEKGEKADALPSQWAGMILVGDVQPLAGHRYPFLFGGGLVLLLLAGGIWWHRKRRSIRQ